MLRFVLAATLLSLTGAVGCAHTSVPQHAEPAARRLYTVGEARYAAGYPEQAVALWRHAITQLPPTKAYDELRHRLILRLAYGQLAAYHKLGKLAHLYDARRMLERYLVTHEGLFGDEGDAKAERGEVYEILYEVESRIENPPVGGTPVPAGEATLVADASLPGAASVATATESAALAHSDEAAAAATGKAKPKRRRSGKKEDAEGSERTVIVTTKERPSVDDPVLKKRLAAWNPEDGLVLTAPGIQPWLPARAYVRIDGFAQRVDGEGGGAHAVASAVIRAVRPALRACYDGAFARAPADFALAKFELSVDAEGNVSEPRLVGGMVGDPLGDACVLERLGNGKVEDDAPIEPMRVAVRLVFFYDGPVDFHEPSGTSVRSDLDVVADAARRTTRRGRYRRPSEEPPRALPPITQ